MALIPSKQVGAKANAVLENVTCDSSVAVGDWVRVSAGTIVRGLGDNDTNSSVIGVCESKLTSVLCNVRVSGVSEAVFTGLDTTKPYFLSPTVLGGHTTTVPGPGTVLVPLGRPFSSTRMVINIGRKVIRT